MDSGPRNWKWMVPGFFIVPAMLAFAWLLGSEFAWVRQAALVFLFAAALLALATIWNFIRYVVTWWNEEKIMLMHAANETADVLALRAANGVHPETLKMMHADRRRATRLISGTLAIDEQPYAVLNADPGITDYFVAYFLYHSTEKKVMSKHQLVDGRKKVFDPSGELTEYEMYDRLINHMVRMKMITRQAANDSSYWMNEWSPKAAAADLGIAWDWIETTAVELLHRMATRSDRPFVFEDLNAKEKA